MGKPIISKHDDLQTTLGPRERYKFGQTWFGHIGGILLHGICGSVGKHGLR